MTILGSHTETEVKQFIAAQQSEVDDIQSAYDNAASTWAATDGVTAAAWLTDWNAWKSQWTDAVVKELGLDSAENTAISMVTLGPVLGAVGDLEDVTPDESGYNNMLAAWYFPGSLDSVVAANANGLNQRLVAGIGNFPRAVPPPENATDIDLVAINDAQPTVNAVNTVVKAAGTVGSLIPSPTAALKWIAGGLGIIITGIAVAWAVEGVETVKAVKAVKNKIIG